MKHLAKTLMIAAAALAAAAQAADPVPYLDPVNHTTNLCTDYTFYAGETTLTSGWYVVAGDITNDERIVVSGNVNLILCDNASLTANAGVNVDVSVAVVDGGEVVVTNSLTIWAQSDAAAEGSSAGKLIATGGNVAAGIGGGENGSCGTVTVNGGEVKATGGRSAAGIGGGARSSGGTVTVNGGAVAAQGGDNDGGAGGGAGIGGGFYGSGGTVTVNGGEVTAQGGSGGAGIGGGEFGSGGTVTVNGGTVTAQGGRNGAGIGGGDGCPGGTVTIAGGAVTAQGGRGAVGIGAGAYSSGGTVTVKPSAGTSITVAAGADADGAAPIDGSPFTVETDVTGRVAGKKFVRTWVPPTVSNVAVRQRWPWNGLVDIDCTVSGIDGTDYGLDFAVAAVMPDSSVHNATNFWVAKDGKKSPVQGVCSNGNYRLIWDARADLGPELYSNVVVRVTVVSGHARAQFWEGGPYWAMTNVGAEKPENYGLYFWWGDTVGYKHENGKWVASDGSSSGFRFSDDNSTIYTYGKYIATLQGGNGNEKWLTADGVLAPAHDAAQAHWGGAWRMPTDQELADLLSKCDWTWMTQNGVNGWTVTGRGDYESASIFLPCAGFGGRTSLYTAGSDGRYWSSVPRSDGSNSWYLDFHSRFHITYYYYRYDGFSVRPVQGFTE